MIIIIIFYKVKIVKYWYIFAVLFSMRYKAAAFSG